MSLYRIQEALYGRPWLIKPSLHLSMVPQMGAYLSRAERPIIPAPASDDLDAPTPVSDAIQAISVSGVLGKHLSLLETQCGGCDLDEICEGLKQARDNPDVSKIILLFDTPGGKSVGVPETGELIRQIAQVKPVIGFTETQCCSGGYWLASQCTAFFCAPSADVGHIGVWSLFWDQTGKLENEGTQPIEISSGEFKTLGAWWRKMSAEEKAILQSDSDKLYARFKSAVKASRNVSDDVCKGLIYDGETAVRNGLADGLFSDLDSLLTFLSKG